MKSSGTFSKASAESSLASGSNIRQVTRLQERRLSNLLFIDECGRSNPEPHLSDAVFALGAVAMDEEDVRNYVDRANAIKAAFFSNPGITFHEPMMRTFDGPYYFNGDTQKQRQFDAAIDQLVSETNFVAFGVGVRKNAFQTDFVARGIDPYLPVDVYSVAILMLLERYVDFVTMAPERRMGRVTFESQGPREDALHQLEYARLLIDGTQWVPQSAFQQAIEAGARFAPKAGSDPMELADMLSREIWEWVRGGCSGSPKRWPLFGQKIYARGNKQMGTFGVKVFPDSDIRTSIESHRQASGLQREN